MSEKNSGGSAFPWCGDLNETPFINLGMTLRDYFAAKALQALIGKLDDPKEAGEVAEAAYLFADDMLKAREA